MLVKKNYLECLYLSTSITQHNLWRDHMIIFKLAYKRNSHLKTELGSLHPKGYIHPSVKVYVSCRDGMGRERTEVLRDQSRHRSKKSIFLHPPPILSLLKEENYFATTLLKSGFRFKKSSSNIQNFCKQVSD